MEIRGKNGGGKLRKRTRGARLLSAVGTPGSLCTCHDLVVLKPVLERFSSTGLEVSLEI